MDPYKFRIILSFLSVLCICDKNVLSSMADSKLTVAEMAHDNDCVEDHEEGERCDCCCGKSYLHCYQEICKRCTQYEDGEFICEPTPYETLSQICLSIAMALGVLILLVVLWKIRYSRRARPRDIADDDTPRGENVSRLSLSSIQIRIVARLQNRPPRYETSYNYNQRVEAAKQESTVDEGPPAYDAVEENVEKGPPPPYMIVLREEESRRQGIDNNSFVMDDLTSENTNSTINATNPDSTRQNTTSNNTGVITNCETHI